MAATRNIAIGCIAAAVLVGVIVACVVGGIFALGLNDVAEKAENEGVEFGKRTDQRGCQTEALRRLRAAIRSGNLINKTKLNCSLTVVFKPVEPPPTFA